MTNKENGKRYNEDIRKKLNDTKITDFIDQEKKSCDSNTVWCSWHAKKNVL